MICNLLTDSFLLHLSFMEFKQEVPSLFLVLFVLLFYSGKFCVSNRIEIQSRFKVMMCHFFIISSRDVQPICEFMENISLWMRITLLVTYQLWCIVKNLLRKVCLQRSLSVSVKQRYWQDKGMTWPWTGMTLFDFFCLFLLFSLKFSIL